jgi:3-oxoadipate enol-lactonase
MPSWTHPATGTLLAYDDRGSGPPLVLVHAFPLDRRMWQVQTDELSDAHRVLTPDVFGFGESGLPAGGWTMDSFADALADWLMALKIDTAVIGGLSMGGYIALAFARRHPGRVTGLILADTRAEADTVEAKASREKTLALADEKGAAGVIESMLPKLLGDYTRMHRPEVIATVHSIAAVQTTAGVVAGIRALRDRPDSTAALAGFRFPALVLVGADDALTPPSAARAMVDELPDAASEQFATAGHLSNLETPAEFTAAVRRWLKP